MEVGMMEEQSSRILINLIKELQTLCLTNMEYFQSGKQSHQAKFHVAFCLLYEYLDIGIVPCVLALSPRLSEYDLSPQVKGNGYRSLLRIVQKCCLFLVQLNRHIIVYRDSMLFRRAYYLKELEAYVATIGQLRACLYYAQQVMNYCQEETLFVDEELLDESVADKLMMDFEMLNQDCFYGRCLGFQFCESMQRPLQVVAITMASFSEGYQENSQFMQLATTVFNSGKYIMNPELRAKQVVNITRSADVKFCKAFWGITETDLLRQLPSLVCPSVEVDEVLHLGPDSFEMMREDGTDTVIITPPCAHTGPSPVHVRLISYHRRDGQPVHNKPTKTTKHPVIPKPKSPGLLIHCHGGGFVAQSSKSHEVYLRHWARDINVPILSIDYSLAPESPFPRALEECFYAYSWALQNHDKLGSTGKTIILAGDSAGGNLIISTAMRAASFGIRSPDNIMAIYPAILARFTPSPSRLMAIMDPLLPIGILSRCLGAYAGVSDELLHGIIDPVLNSDAPYKLEEEEDADTDWVIIYDKADNKNKAGKVDDDPSTASSDQFNSAMTGSLSDDFLSAPQTPSSAVDGAKEKEENLGTSVDGATSDSNSQIVANNNNLQSENTLDLPPLVSLNDDMLSDHPDNTLTSSHSIMNSESTECDDNMTKPESDREKIKAEQASSAPDEMSIIDLNDSESEQPVSGELVIVDLIPDGDPVMSSLTSDALDMPSEQMPSSLSCPDFKQETSDAYLKNKSVENNNKSSIFNEKSKLTLPLPRTTSVPEFPSNRPRMGGSMSPNDFVRHRSNSNSPLKVVRRLPIVKNPYMSPLLAPDELLLGLPDICLVACHLDPLLDDAVTFAKKLQKLGKKADLHLIDDLPHGFLNFCMSSKDAKKGSDFISDKLKEMFKMDLNVETHTNGIV